MKKRKRKTIKKIEKKKNNEKNLRNRKRKPIEIIEKKKPIEIIEKQEWSKLLFFPIIPYKMRNVYIFFKMRNREGYQTRNREDYQTPLFLKK